MKRSYQGLSLEIRELRDKYVIVVEDNTDKEVRYKDRFECIKNDVEAAMFALDCAKEWLWNMGNYNGQANLLMRKHTYEWHKILKITK